MKITCSKRGDILKRRDEWKNQYDTQKAKYDEEFSNWETAYDDKADQIKHNVEEIVSKFNKLTFNIDVQSQLRHDHYSINIRVNEYNKFDDDVALSWSCRFEVSDDGEIVKSTNSWSGLTATTPAQIESLKQSVECIEILMNTDWEVLLNTHVPNYKDYVKTQVPEDLSRDFDRELLEADIEDMMGTHTIAEYDGPTRYYTNRYGNKVYLGFISETPKMYKVFEVSSAELDSTAYEDAVNFSYNIRKDIVLDHLVTPLNTEEI